MSVHVPGGGPNRHLLDAARLARMKPGAFLVNTARGDVVDTRALVDALPSGALEGAGLDVYEDEPDVPEELRKLDNAVLLPHVGSATGRRASRWANSCWRTCRPSSTDGSRPAAWA